MIKFKISFLFFLLPAFLFSQISIDNSDMPSVGDTIRSSNTFDLGIFDYATGGADHIWDFEGLFPLHQQIDTFISLQETPLIYQVVFFLSSNMAQPLLTFETFPGFNVSDAFGFYNNSEISFKMTGIGATFNGIPIPNKFEDDDVIYKFPINYGNIDSSLSTYGMALPGIGYVGSWKKRVNHCDGWGTLKTPYGSFSTIRIKSEIIQYDSIYIDSLGVGIPILRNFTEYKWLGNDYGIPLCTFTDDGISTAVTYIDSVRSLIVDIQPKLEVDNPIHIFPNPTINNAFRIDAGLNQNAHVIISLRNSVGKIIRKLLDAELHAGNAVRYFDLSGKNMSKGLYFITVDIDGKLFTEKIILR